MSKVAAAPASTTLERMTPPWLPPAAFTLLKEQMTDLSSKMAALEEHNRELQNRGVNEENVRGELAAEIENMQHEINALELEKADVQHANIVRARGGPTPHAMLLQQQLLLVLRAFSLQRARVHGDCGCAEAGGAVSQELEMKLKIEHENIETEREQWKEAQVPSARS
jgi:hypothetical protein